MKPYTTISTTASFEYEDRKSVFIGIASPVSTERDALDFIEAVKKRYPDARHHVYAYVLRENSTARFSDDHEPQGTAGLPTLDVIKKKDCTDVAIVVTRYFGGTLLGTGGLVRAYTAAAVGALENAGIVRYDIYSEYELRMTYSDHVKVSAILSDSGFRVTETLYTDEVALNGSIVSSESEPFEKKLTEITSGRIKIEKKGEKFDY